MSVNANQDEVGGLSVQWGLKGVWEGVSGGTEVVVRGSVEEAVEWVRGLVEGGEAEEVLVLVTGSVHLVGGFLEVLETGGEGTGASGSGSGSA